MVFFMFQFEITVLHINCFIKCNEYYLKSNFSNVFSIYLKYPKRKNKTREKKYNINKSKTRGIKENGNKMNSTKLTTGHTQSVDFISTVDQLRHNMRLYPMVLTVITKQNKKKETGSIQIPWKNMYFDFLDDIIINNSHEIVEKAEYHLYHDITSKRVATVHLKIKLSNFNDNCECRSVYSDSNVSTYIGKKDIILNPGTIKTKYRGRPIEEYSNKKKNITKLPEIETQVTNLQENVKSSVSDFYSVKYLQDELSNYFINKDNDAFPKQVYCVGYCAVNDDVDKDNKLSSSTMSTKTSNKPVSDSSSVSEKSLKKYSIKICDDDCPAVDKPRSINSIYVPEDIRSMLTVTQCEDIYCDNKVHKDVVTPVDSTILLDLDNQKKPCCEVVKVKEITVGVKANVKFNTTSCDCTCDCTFGFSKKTTYCNVCKGYEGKGDDLFGQLIHDLPHPCPLYHSLMDKHKSKSLILSTSGSGSKKTLKSGRSGGRSSSATSKDFNGSKERKLSMSSKPSIRTIEKDVDKKRLRKHSDKKTMNIETENKSSSKKSKVDEDTKFKFHYGFQGIPARIGHSKCALCQGGDSGLGVPKCMGWLWTADNIPGMKFRPNWKPGATNKHVVKLLNMAKNPEKVVSKKKKKRDLGKKRKNDKRPLLIVHKRDGEFNVTMETMKLHQKTRALNQFPYEDKPVISYTIGRTLKENLERQKKRTHVHNELEKEKRIFIESSFKNECKEICLKTYNQALGILPETEDPDCACFPTSKDQVNSNLVQSCSCSLGRNSLDTETDSDEWFVEFTPPNAKFDPNYKMKKVIKIDSSTQYTYLDYRVKLLDRFGNPVPRFFKGPDGKEQCSDLGGFWGLDKKWLEINIDGYISADGRWAPNTFIGPSNEQVETTTGKFQSTNGNWLVVGVDGFISKEGKWQFYKKLNLGVRKTRLKNIATKISKGNIWTGNKKGRTFASSKGKESKNKQNNTAWSCFGDISPKYLSEMGIIGHGHDKGLLKKSLTEMRANGMKIKIPQPRIVPKSLFTKRNDKKNPHYFEERFKCSHTLPSDKGITGVDELGNKTYFKLKSNKNQRPKERVDNLLEQGISLSSFHVPCLSSFISSKQQRRDRIFALAAKLKT